jgi:signal transduction histidine kinase
VVSSRRLELETRLEDGVCVRADRERLIEAVLHLIDNAIRFTPDGGTVTAGVGRRDGDAIVTVSDTGVGIPPNELNWIFDKVYEVGDILRHSSGRHAFGSRGFGLGLALCRAIVDVHGGRIDVRSVPGRGSTFTIVLPLAPSAGNVDEATRHSRGTREEVLV